jgi:N-acetylglucosamine kinase-like BadF-type ATPase
MILLAESGSTKTQWSLIGLNKIEELTNTLGINPFNLTNNEIESIIRPISIDIDTKQIEAIYFFGAGCSTPKNIIKIALALQHIFACQQIEVNTDLKAACLSLAGDQAALIGLLGTGSNSCIWDGKVIVQNIPSLGYVLGDEGGGVSIGKQLVADYLKQQMPEHLSKHFSKKYKITVESVLERVYQVPMPNRYLASFAPFAEEHIDDNYCRQIIYDQFKSFIERNIIAYQHPEQYPLYFCGSIAYSHRDILEEICNEHHIIIKNIVKEPINGLSNYFQQKLS